MERTDDLEDIPEEVWRLLPFARADTRRSGNWAYYPSRADAAAALSVACVRLGRLMAGP